MKKAFLSLIVIFSLPAFTPAQEPKFIRVTDEDGKITGLEVAITHYTNRNKTVTVDLVGVVHVADRAYYERLNKRFTEYDAVLYELVAPLGTRVPKAGKSDSLSSFLTGLMSSMLDLESQLKCVDYHKKNFVHADLSFQAMLDTAKGRGESGMTLGLAVLADLFKQQNTTGQKKDKTSTDDIDLTAALLSPVLLKRQMARQMANNMELGPTLQALLVADRNKKACAVLTDEITDGKTKIAIFYGAAHMPDFDKRLREQFGLQRQGQEWLTAWNLRDR
jgi:hypothetical protein